MTTAELNQLLDKIFTIPVEIRTQTFQNNSPYPALNNLENDGFSFTGKELLHAIGSKIAALPSSSRDESIRAAYLYAHLLDFDGSYLGYKTTVNIDSDLQTNRSNEIGIGMGCLIANKLFGVNWDTLEPIKGTGKRFDYRATNPGQNYAYEFKGSKHRGKQNSQIENGLEKKADMHARNERYDVELIISSLLDVSTREPRIVLADPPFNGYRDEFTEQAQLFYRLRHYSRIAQFVGNVALSRTLYKQAQLLIPPQAERISPDQIDELGFRTYSREIALRENQEHMGVLETIKLQNQGYIGRWINDWIPPINFNVRHTYSLPPIDEASNLEIFQGVTTDVYTALTSIETEKIKGLLKEKRQDLIGPNDGQYSSFEDGTIMSYRLSV